MSSFLIAQYIIKESLPTGSILKRIFFNYEFAVFHVVLTGGVSQLFLVMELVSINNLYT